MLAANRQRVAHLDRGANVQRVEHSDRLAANSQRAADFTSVQEALAANGKRVSHLANTTRVSHLGSIREALAAQLRGGG